MVWRPKLGGFCLLTLALSLAAPVRGQESFRKLTDGVNKKVVKLYGAGSYKRLPSYGTGILVSPKGYILTVNNHLLDTRDLRVHLWDGRKYHAKIIVQEPSLDVALVRIESTVDGLPYFDMAKECKRPLAEPGDWVLAFSNQFKIANREEPQSVQRGTVAAYSKLNSRSGAFNAPYRGDVYFIDAITNNPGAAGGIITNRKGQLLGLIGRELRNRLSDTYINYAVPIQAKTEITRDKKKVTVDIAEFVRLGMQGKYIPGKAPEKRKGPGVYTGIVLVPNVVERTPPYVEEIEPKSPAAKAGLKVDDLIVYMDGQLMSTISIFMDQLSSYQPGDEVEIQVERKGELVAIKLKMAKLKKKK
jgi:serine protease Do